LKPNVCAKTTRAAILLRIMWGCKMLIFYGLLGPYVEAWSSDSSEMKCQALSDLVGYVLMEATHTGSGISQLRASGDGKCFNQWSWFNNTSSSVWGLRGDICIRYLKYRPKTFDRPIKARVSWKPKSNIEYDESAFLIWDEIQRFPGI
jgi:hypothetical protein